MLAFGRTLIYVVEIEVEIEMGTQLPPSGTFPQFLAHVRCGQTAGWIKMPLGMEVGLGPTQHPQKKGTAPRNFWPMSIVAKRLVDETPLGTEVDLAQATLDREPSPLREMATAAPSFRPMSIVVKRLDWMHQDTICYRSG